MKKCPDDLHVFLPADNDKENRVKIEILYPCSKIWITKDGKRMHIKDMTDLHLNNAIKYLKDIKNSDYYINEETQEEMQKALDILKIERKRRKDERHVKGQN